MEGLSSELPHIQEQIANQFSEVVDDNPEKELELGREMTPLEQETLHEMGIDLPADQAVVASETAIVAHNANTLLLIEKAHEHGATDIELDLRFSREPRPWNNHRLHIRHGQIPVPFREYPTPLELITAIDPDKKIVLDLKYLPKHPLEGRSTRTMLNQLQNLLQELEDLGRDNIALTGGNEELFSHLAQRYPPLELRWTVWTERGYKRLKEKYDEKVKAVAVRGAVLKKLGMQAFEGKKVYVFGADEREREVYKRMGVAGIGTDSYKNGRREE